MPNWCYTDFTVSGDAEDISRFRQAVRGSDNGEETPFDFNRVIPTPSELLETIADDGSGYDVYYGDAEAVLGYYWVKNLGIRTVERLRDHFDADPRRRATADHWKANIEKYGAPTWYEWSIEHWGTKWNARYSEVTENGNGSLHVQFDTAWTFPFPLFEKLVVDFPTLVFEGTAYEPGVDFYITFEGRNGEFTCEDDEEARLEAAAAYAEEDESLEATA
jgi:Ferredoxin-like domain in Api92-like protein